MDDRLRLLRGLRIRGFGYDVAIRPSDRFRLRGMFKGNGVKCVAAVLHSLTRQLRSVRHRADRASLTAAE